MSINQINNNAGMNEQALAGNASMIINGLEKELNKSAFSHTKEAHKAEFNELARSVKMVSNACAIKPVKKYEGDQERENNNQQEKKQRDFGQAQRGKAPMGKAFSWHNSGDYQSQDLLLHQTEIRGVLNLELLKEYFHILAEILIYNPSTREIFLKMEELDRRIGLSADALNRLKARVSNLIFEELAYHLKRELSKQLSSTEKIVNFIIKTREVAALLNFSFFNKILSRPTIKANNYLHNQLQSILADNIKFATSDIKGVVKIAKELGLEIDPSTFASLAEKIKREPSGTIVVDNSDLAEERVKQLLLDEYKLVEVAEILEPNLMRKSLLLFQKWQVIKVLQAANISMLDIESARLEARKIAWAKCVAVLKELHLKRVFSSSMKEFSQHSITIKQYTAKAKQLGPEWIKERLERLALDSASYKLELLHSMQALEYNKEREKDIKALTITIQHYKKECNG